MSKKKNNEIQQYKLWLEYVCPITNQTVKKQLEWSNFRASAQECQLCGSHGDITLWIDKCPSCGQFHNDIEIKSW